MIHGVINSFLDMKVNGIVIFNHCGMILDVPIQKLCIMHKERFKKRSLTKIKGYLSTKCSWSAFHCFSPEHWHSGA